MIISKVVVKFKKLPTNVVYVPRIDGADMNNFTVQHLYLASNID